MKTPDTKPNVVLRSLETFLWSGELVESNGLLNLEDPRDVTPEKLRNITLTLTIHHIF
jgi:hypothetical protein